MVRSSYFYFSLKYVRWSYVLSQGHITTYRYFFLQEWKKPLNLQVERHLEWLNGYICFKLFSSLRISIFLAGILRWWHVQSAVHVTTRLISPESTRSTTFVSKTKWLNRVGHVSLWVKTSNACKPNILWFAPHTFIFNKICQMVIYPVTGTYNHVTYFFAQK